MSKVVVLQHVPYEGPGRIVPVFRDFGIQVEVRRLFAGDEVPTDLDEVRALVVLGGPMSVADAGRDAYPFLAREVDLLTRMVKHDRPVLGICLGAQLLAHAAGAKVYPNVQKVRERVVTPGPSEPEEREVERPVPEIGWLPVTFPFPGGTEPLVFGCNDGAMMFHWHFDTFDLPKLPAPPNMPASAPPPQAGSVLMSSSKLCKNQAFRFKSRLFGFQYHFEFTPADVEAIASAQRDTILKVLGSDGERRLREETARFYPRYARLGDRILQNFVQFLKVYQERGL